MTIVAEFSIPTASFALAETLPRFPDVTVEVDRIAAHTPGTTMPCLWVVDGRLEEFSTAMTADPTVEEVQSTADFDGERLYHVTWSDEINRFVEAMVDHQGVVLEASGRGDRWTLRFRFMAREQLEAFQAYFEERGHSFRLERLVTPEHPRHTHGDVTSQQYEALTIAAERGYFKVPRQASTQDVADELGVSDQAISELLRRGTENLVRDMLVIEPNRGRR